MKPRSFGKHRFDCLKIGFGAWSIGGSWGAQADTAPIAAMKRALDLGCNFIDTAAGYGNGYGGKLRRHNWRRSFWYGGKKAAEA